MTSYSVDRLLPSRIAINVVGSDGVGMSSMLSLPNLAILNYVEEGRITTLRIIAEDTGIIDFSGVTTITMPDDGNSLDFVARDANTVIDLNMLNTFPNRVDFIEENDGAILLPAP